MTLPHRLAARAKGFFPYLFFPRCRAHSKTALAYDRRREQTVDRIWVAFVLIDLF